jgi:hypothetical protein
MCPKEVLQMPRQTPSSHNHSTPYSAQLNYPISELSSTFRCVPSDAYALKKAVFDLCTKCVIRFGIPDDVRNSMGDALQIPASNTLRYGPIGHPIDPRWVLLARALELPGKNDLPIISLRVPAKEVLDQIRVAVSELLEEVNATTTKPVTPTICETLKDKIEKVRDWGLDQQQGIQELTRPIAAAALRQLKLFHELGVNFTLTSPHERLVLTSCAVPAREEPSPAPVPRSAVSAWTWQGEQPSTIDRRHRDLMPPADLLRPLGLRWQWQEGRGWEPTFPNSSKYNTTLFGHSSVYLGMQLNLARRGEVSRPLETVTILEALRRAVKTFEVVRFADPHEEVIAQARLLERQNRILDRVLDYLWRTPQTRR